jgi:hypothetical protein
MLNIGNLLRNRRDRLGNFGLVCGRTSDQANWMKAHELLSSPDAWCQESPAQDAQGNKVEALNPNAVRWCALAAVQKTYPPSQWEQMMDRLLRALSVSEKGITQLTKWDKACCLMEWNDDRTYSFRDIREVLLEADV